MNSREVKSSRTVSYSERERERRRMDHIVTLRALLIEAGAAGLFVYLAWLVFTFSSHNGS